MLFGASFVPVLAQVSSWDTSALTAVVDAPAGGASIRARLDSEAATFVPNGTPVTISGPADASGYLPVTWSGGTGFIPGDQLAAVGDSYMPSATDAGLFLPVQASGDGTITITIDPTGLVTQVTPLAPVSGDARAAGGNTSLLGIQGGNTTPGVDPGTGVSTAGVAGQGAPGALPAQTAPTGGAWNKGIIATAEEAQKGAIGTLGTNDLYVALPSRTGLRKTVQLVLSDAQGNPLGSAQAAPVKDVGPWRVNDAYWESNARPYAEAQKGRRVSWVKGQGYMASSKGRKCNGAGIDISTALWTKLKPGLSRRQALNTTGAVNWSF